MDIDELLSLLDSYTVFIKNNPLLHTTFNGATLLFRPLHMALADKDAVIFCRTSYFNELPTSLIEERAFFLYVDEPLKPFQGKTFLALMKSESDWTANFELLSAEFRELQRCKDKILELTALVNRGAALETLVSEAAEIVGAPASILDNSLSFLAVSSNFPPEIAKGEERKSGTLPEDALPLLKAKGLVNPKKPFDLVRFNYDIGDGVHTNYFSLIHSRDTIVGSISFFTKESELRKSRVDMIPTIAQILSIHMQRNNAFLLNKSLYYAHLFKKLQEGEIEQDHDQIAKRFSMFGYQLKRHLHVFVVDLSREYLPAEQAQPLAEKLHPHIHNSIYTLGHTSITFISSSDAIVEEGDCDFEALRNDVRGTKIDIGISSIFVNPERMPYHTDEAKRALKLGRRLNPDARIYPFSEYRLLDLANNVTDLKTLYSYRYPPLVHVIDLDRENNTHLAYTLYEYLQDPAHPQAVADRLFIHKNTLYWRLEKIRGIMGRDFKDAETIANIQMTFHVLRIQNRFDKLILRKEAD